MCLYIAGWRLLICWQTCSDYRDIQKGMMIAALHYALDISQTYLERAVESLNFGHFVLHHFAPIWVNFGGRAAAAVVSFGISICTSPKQIQRESQVITLRWLVSLLWRFKREPCRQCKTNRSIKTHFTSTNHSGTIDQSPKFHQNQLMRHQIRPTMPN